MYDYRNLTPSMQLMIETIAEKKKITPQKLFRKIRQRLIQPGRSIETVSVELDISVIMLGMIDEQLGEDRWKKI